MRRRQFITLIDSAAAAWPFAALAQQPGKLPHVGVLVSGSPPHPFADAFWRGLSMMDAEIGSKRVQLLRELIPNLDRIAVLATTPTTTPYGRPFVEDMRLAATRAV
jgi:putative ABC transport system substrate-binding protein